MLPLLAILAAGALGSLRAGAAVGGGDVGVAGYLSLQGERWLTENVALGARAAFGGQGSVDLENHTRTAMLAGVDILGGIPYGAGRVVGGAGVAFASVQERPGSPLCLFSLNGQCPAPPALVRSQPLCASLVGGVIGYQGRLALSVLARLQSMGHGWDLVAEFGIGFVF